MSEVKDNYFIQGYVCAVANLLRERDVAAMAEGLLKSIGKVSVKSLKISGVDQQDIDVLKKYKLI
ncbi:MAG: hypothetical protein JWQ09_5850 [Segetibacter sp.]|nr:hypothetical protein [Segetibacter sp.]